MSHLTLLLLFLLFKSFIIFIFHKFCAPNEMLNLSTSESFYKFLEAFNNMIWLCFTYWFNVYHHSDNYYPLEFSVMLNFVWVLNCLIHHRTMYLWEAEFFFKILYCWSEPITVVRTSPKDYLSAIQTNKYLLILCVHFMTTILGILMAFSWPRGISCQYTFVIVSWMTFKWIFPLKELPSSLRNQAEEKDE